MSYTKRFDRSELDELLKNPVRIMYEECPSNRDSLIGMDKCSHYGNPECRKREECSYYQKMQQEENEWKLMHKKPEVS